MYRRQESRPPPKKRKCNKANFLFEEALQIAVKRKEAKAKEKRKGTTHLNTAFQRVARRDESFPTLISANKYRKQ